jgi:hypothetical protein
MMRPNRSVHCGCVWDVVAADGTQDFHLPRRREQAALQTPDSVVVAAHRRVKAPAHVRKVFGKRQRAVVLLLDDAFDLQCERLM